MIKMMILPINPLHLHHHCVRGSIGSANIVQTTGTPVSFGQGISTGPLLDDGLPFFPAGSHVQLDEQAVFNGLSDPPGVFLNTSNPFLPFTPNTSGPSMGPSNFSTINPGWPFIPPNDLPDLWQ